MLARRTTGGQTKIGLGNKKTVQTQKNSLETSVNFSKVVKKDKKQHDFLILGATGLQGKIVSRELIEKGYSVALSDYGNECKGKMSEEQKNMPFFPCNLEDEDIVSLIKKVNPHIVVNCSEDEYIVRVLKACIDAGAHHIDLGSYGQEIQKIFDLHNSMKEKKLIGITGCGSTPGIGNVMLKFAAKKLDTIETIEAGFAWDSNIKEFVVPFSMDAIFYEFVTPATIVENGEFIMLEPLKNLEKRTFKGIGEQVVMPVDHSEPFTFHRHFKDKGVKNIRFYGGFPKHSFERIIAMIEVGMYQEYGKIMVNGKSAYVSDLVADILKLKSKPQGYKEVENLWVDVYGKKNGKEKVIRMECLVPTLEGWEDAGCNIDTGFPAAIMAEMILKGTIKEYGSFSPEVIIPEEEFFQELAKKNMMVYENGELINQPVIEVKRRKIRIKR